MKEWHATNRMELFENNEGYINSLINSGARLTEAEWREWIIKDEDEYNDHYNEQEREWLIDELREAGVVIE